MNPSYSRDQYATGLLAFVVLFGIVIGGVVIASGGFIAGVVVVAFTLSLSALFYRLRVEVDSRTLSLTYGVGLVRKSFAVADICNAEPGRSKWYYGWGIRLTPHGWMYNISGLDVVRIEFESGKTCLVGTEEPARLVAALEDARNG